VFVRAFLEERVSGVMWCGGVGGAGVVDIYIIYIHT
jgi:hypothetical protein